MKKIIRFLLTANVSSENYKLVKEDMHKNNVLMLKMLSAIATTIFFICTIIGLFVPNMNSKFMAYVTGGVFSGAILLVALFVKNKKVHTLCMYLFDILLLGAGLLISLVSAPQQLTITLIPVALLVPLFFDTKPYRFLIVVLLTDLVYMICAPFMKPADILALDMVDVLVFSISGVLIGIVLTKVKVERYVYAREIRKTATYDGLTGCYNRAAYQKYIEDNSGNISESFVIILVDINGLKSVNDSIGHEAGDELIIAVSDAMNAVFSKIGNCYRIGGDEFLAFVEIGETKLKEMIGTLQKTLGEHDGELVKSITVSAGYATAGDCKDGTMKSMINVADKRMYENKARFYSLHGNMRRHNG